MIFLFCAYLIFGRHGIIGGLAMGLGYVLYMQTMSSICINTTLKILD